MVRPRLTTNEIKFMVESLKCTLAFLDVKEGEFKELESKVYRLRKELQYNSMVWKELKEAKEQFEQMKGLPMQLIDYRFVCNSLIRRLEGLLEGRRLHSGLFASHSLEQLFP